MLGAPQVPVQGQDAPPLLNLNCVIEDEYKAFIITIGHDCFVDNLKKEIKKERALDTLKDAHTLELWKVSAIDGSRCEVTSLFSAQGLYRCEASRHSGSTYWDPGK